MVDIKLTEWASHDLPKNSVEVKLLYSLATLHLYLVLLCLKYGQFKSWF